MNQQKLTGLLPFLVFILLLQACQRENGLPEKRTTDPYHVSPQLARAVAQRISPSFLQSMHAGAASRTQSGVTDIPLHAIRDSLIVPDKYGDPALYIYNYTNDSGFVVISADFRHEPVCAFVPTGHMEEDSVPASLLDWFDATIENIEMVRDGAYDNTARAVFAWNDLIQQTGMSDLADVLRFPPPDDDPPNCDDGWVVVVKGPLLPTQWGQWCTYNNLAPAANCTNGCLGTPNTPTGCVATAMSQVLRYWSHPNQYNYNYAGMLANQGNGEVQRMMRDAGISVNMSYACAGSGAQTYHVDNAFKDRFSFSSADGPSLFNQNNYTSGSYLTVKSNLNNNWPVILAGFNKRRNRFLGIIYSYSEGHAWVCDGYWSASNYCYSYLRFHMNWGWNETWGGNNFNGWYAFNMWNPGTRNYQYARSYIYNIHP